MKSAFGAPLALLALLVGAAQVDAQTCGNAVGGYCGNAQGSQCCPTSAYCQPWNSDYYQCLTVPTGCGAMETDVDYYGNDIGSVSNVSPQECCDRCGATAGCNYFTFVNLDPQGPTCYMKSAKGASVRNVGALSGQRIRATPTPTPAPSVTPTPAPNTCSKAIGDSCGTSTAVSCCPTGSYCMPWDTFYYQCLAIPMGCGAMETDVDYYGGDIGSVFRISPAECCATCQKTAGCKYYTFVNTDPSGPACYMKSSKTSSVRKVGVVSGSVITSTPAPTPTPSRTPVPAGSSQCGTQLKQVYFHGKDIKELSLTDPEQCCSECAKTQGCLLYSHIYSKTTGISRCVLKSLGSEKTNYGDSQTIVAVSAYVLNPLV